MWLEGIINIFLGAFSTALSGFEAVGLPIQLIQSLNTILCYGIWVVGIDIMSLFVASVVGWWGIKFILGAIVFIWELLPFT